MAAKVTYVRDVGQLAELSADARRKLEAVQQRYVFRANDYYLGLIDWSDPQDPIRALVIPNERELVEWGTLDASNEEAVTVVRGVQHKYADTVLLLVNEVCGAYCRYCFRKRLFIDGNDEATNDVSAGLAYIAAHPEVTDVLLTGGDPLIMSTRRILDIVRQVREIPHVHTIRLGTKMPAFNPWRVLDDPALVQGLAAHSSPGRRIYLMAHFDHPRELTEPAIAGLDALIRAGIICVNQSPLIRGVNDTPEVLADLFERLAFIGCPQYYLFQGRPTAGNEPFELPLVAGYEACEAAKARISGLARRVRYCMSHESGKIEIVGLDARYIYMRYHRAKCPEDVGRFFACHRDEAAYWLDDLRPVTHLGATPSEPAAFRPFLASSAESRAPGAPAATRADRR